MPKKIDVPELKQVGAAIRSIRQAQNMTLDQVAKASGVDTGNLSRLERGLQGFSMDALAALCRVFNVSLSDLLAGGTRADAPAGKVSLCLSVPEVEIDFAATEGKVSQAIKKTERVMSTTAKVGSKAFGFRLGNDDAMGSMFPPRMGVIIDPDVKPKNESYVLATVQQRPIFRQYVVNGGRAFLKAQDPRYPLIPVDRSVSILGVAKQVFLDI